MLSLVKTFLYVFGLYKSFGEKYYLINNTNHPHHKHYIAYIEHNNKMYDYNNYKIFSENVEYINELNSKNLSFNVEVNNFIDKKIFKMNIINKKTCHNCYKENNDIILSLIHI